MNTISYVKSFSKGQITIPKEVREVLGIGDEFWLKLSIENGKIVAEPVESEKDKTSFAKQLLAIKGDWFNPDEIMENREQLEKQLRERNL